MTPKAHMAPRKLSCFQEERVLDRYAFWVGLRKFKELAPEEEMKELAQGIQRFDRAQPPDQKIPTNDDEIAALLAGELSSSLGFTISKDTIKRSIKRRLRDEKPPSLWPWREYLE
jgi:hypothetical protein